MIACPTHPACLVAAVHRLLSSCVVVSPRAVQICPATAVVAPPVLLVWRRGTTDGLERRRQDALGTTAPDSTQRPNSAPARGGRTAQRHNAATQRTDGDSTGTNTHTPLGAHTQTDSADRQTTGTIGAHTRRAIDGRTARIAVESCASHDRGSEPTQARKEQASHERGNDTTHAAESAARQRIAAVEITRVDNPARIRAVCSLQI